MNQEQQLLKEALELFGDMCSAAPVESDEWQWRWRVRYVLEDEQYSAPHTVDEALAFLDHGGNAAAVELLRNALAVQSVQLQAARAEIVDLQHDKNELHGKLQECAGNLLQTIVDIERGKYAQQ